MQLPETPAKGSALKTYRLHQTTGLHFISVAGLGGIAVLLLSCLRFSTSSRCIAAENDKFLVNRETIRVDWEKKRNEVIAGRVEYSSVDLPGPALKQRPADEVIDLFDKWAGDHETLKPFLYSILEERYHRDPPWSETTLTVLQTKRRKDLKLEVGANGTVSKISRVETLTETVERHSGNGRCRVTIRGPRIQKTMMLFPLRLIPTVKKDEWAQWHLEASGSSITGENTDATGRTTKVVIDRDTNVVTSLTVLSPEGDPFFQLFQFDPVMYPGGITLPKASAHIGFREDRPASLTLSAIRNADFAINVPVETFIRDAPARTQVDDSRGNALKRKQFFLRDAVPDVLKEANAR